MSKAYLSGNVAVCVGNGQKKADGDVGVPREWYSRGYLPHRDRIDLLQAVTFRLADSLPQGKLRELEVELSCLEQRQRDAQRRQKVEQWLDAGIGCYALGHPKVAQVVKNSLLHFQGERYELLAWCIMPNHVHVLLEPRFPLAKIVQGWKSVTARWALAHNDAMGLGIPDPRHLWMREYWDRYIRDDNHLKAVIDYIHHNPVKAGLCGEPAEWPWSGNADVLVGSSGNADVPVGSSSCTTPENGDVPKRTADEDVSVPGNGVSMKEVDA